MGSSVHWTINEIRTLFEMRKQGIEFYKIGKKLGRSTGACRKAHEKYRKVYPNIPIKERAQNTYKKPKYSMCWICKKACIDCKKPVKGWKATKIVNHEYEAYIVKQCPEFEPEPWVDKYDCSEFYQNPKKAVKNGKTSRPKT